MYPGESCDSSMLFCLGMSQKVWGCLRRLSWGIWCEHEACSCWAGCVEAMNMWRINFRSWLCSLHGRTFCDSPVLSLKKKVWPLNSFEFTCQWCFGEVYHFGFWFFPTFVLCVFLHTMCRRFWQMSTCRWFKQTVNALIVHLIKKAKGKSFGQTYFQHLQN